MKKVSDVFKSIRFAKNEPRGQSHSSTDNEEHYTVGEKEYNQQLKHVKKMAMQESGGDVVYKKGDHHIEKYGEDSFALYKDGKKQKFYTSIDAAKTAMNESLETLDEKNVPTSPEKWAQAKSQAKAKFDVYPSAYANGWAAKKYKEMGGGWKSVSEAVKDKFDIGEYDQEGDMAKSDLRSIMANAKRLHDMIEDADNLPEWCQNKITLAEDYISTVANYLTAEMNEEVELEEGLQQTLRKFVPGYAKKQINDKMDSGKFGKTDADKDANFHRYKKVMNKITTKEEVEQNDPPFDPDPPKKQPVAKAGKYGQGYSTARHLARMAMQKQSEKMKKPIKEEEMSKKAKIVKTIAKKKKDSADSFQKDPIISKSEVKM